MDGSDLRDLLKDIEGALTPRRLVRQTVKLPVAVRLDRESLQADGRDLTEHGVRVRCRAALPAGARVRVELRPPGGDALAFDAVVRWVLFEDPGCLAGLEFDHRRGPREKLRELLVEFAEGRRPALTRTGLTTRRMRAKCRQPE